MSAPTPLMNGSVLPRNLGIPAFGGNPVAYDRVAGSGSMSPVLLD